MLLDKLAQITKITKDKVTIKLTFDREDINKDAFLKEIEPAIEEHILLFLKGWAAAEKHYNIAPTDTPSPVDEIK